MWTVKCKINLMKHKLIEYLYLCWYYSIFYSLLIFRPEYLDWKLSHFVSNRLLNQNQSYEFSKPQLLLLKVFGNPHTVIFSFFQTLTITVVSNGLRNFDFTKKIGNKTILTYSYIYILCCLHVCFIGASTLWRHWWPTSQKQKFGKKSPCRHSKQLCFAVKHHEEIYL